MRSNTVKPMKIIVKKQDINVFLSQEEFTDLEKVGYSNDGRTSKGKTLEAEIFKHYKRASSKGEPTVYLRIVTP